MIRSGFHSLPVILAIAVASGCGELHDPSELLAERAAEGDTDCGVVERSGIHPLPGESDPIGDAARACVLSALADDRPFRVLVEVPAAENSSYIGWVDDGSTISQLNYCACTDEGGDNSNEYIRWTMCTALEDLGEACLTDRRELCLRCAEAM